MFVCVWVNVLVNTFTSIRKQSLVLYIDDNTNSFTSHSHWLVLVVFLSFTIPDSIFAVIPVQRRVRANERTVLALTVNMNIDWEFIQSDCELYVFICISHFVCKLTERFVLQFFESMIKITHTLLFLKSVLDVFVSRSKYTCCVCIYCFELNII